MTEVNKIIIKCKFFGNIVLTKNRFYSYDDVIASNGSSNKTFICVVCNSITTIYLVDLLQNIRT